MLVFERLLAVRGHLNMWDPEPIALLGSGPVYERMVQVQRAARAGMLRELDSIMALVNPRRWNTLGDVRLRPLWLSVGSGDREDALVEEDVEMDGGGRQAGSVGHGYSARGKQWLTRRCVQSRAGKKNVPAKRRRDGDGEAGAERATRQDAAHAATAQPPTKKIKTTNPVNASDVSVTGMDVVGGDRRARGIPEGTMPTTVFSAESRSDMDGVAASMLSARSIGTKAPASTASGVQSTRSVASGTDRGSTTTELPMPYRDKYGAEQVLSKAAWGAVRVRAWLEDEETDLWGVGCAEMCGRVDEVCTRTSRQDQRPRGTGWSGKCTSACPVASHLMSRS